MLVTKNNSILVRNRNLGFGLKFNGIDQYALGGKIQGFDLINPADDRTVSFWINIEPKSGNNGIIRIGNSSSLSFYVEQNGLSNIIFRFLKDAGTGWGIVTRTPFPMYSLIHVIIVKVGLNATDARLYLNGQPFEFNVTHNLLTEDSVMRSSSQVELGRYSAGSIIKAMYANLTIFDYALTEEQVKLLYRVQGRVPKSMSPILDLDFNHNNGKIIKDKSINSNDFTLQNYTDAEVGIPNQATNTAWVDAYTNKPITV